MRPSANTMASRNFLIAGATGRQGSAVIQALVESGNKAISVSKIYAVTRNADSQSSQGLLKRYPGIHLIQGDLKDSSAIVEQVKHVDHLGVFLAQAHGPTEVSDAKNFIDAAIANKVIYFVYSSVDRGGFEKSQHEATYCKTFSDKYLIEKYLEEKARGEMDYTVLRPTWFIDNTIWGFPGKLCMTGWRDNMKGQKMQITATKDIGRWAAEAFIQPDLAQLRNTALTIASDELDYNQLDKIFREIMGKPVDTTNAWMTFAMIWAINDLYTMFKWIGNNPYGADLEYLRRFIEPTTFRSWVEEEAAKKS